MEAAIGRPDETTCKKAMKSYLNIPHLRLIGCQVKISLRIVKKSVNQWSLCCRLEDAACWHIRVVAMCVALSFYF